MAVYFTADTHFQHKAQAARRGFVSVEVMNEALIEAWNSRVGPKDEIWHLGDFYMGGKLADAEAIFERLQGHKNLVQGNHDHEKSGLALPWERKERLFTWKGYGQRLVLCHYPLLTWKDAHAEHAVQHLHGHCHGNLDHVNPARLDVGVDTRRLLDPWSLEEVVAHLGEYEAIDHHVRKADAAEERAPEAQAAAVSTAAPPRP